MLVQHLLTVHRTQGVTFCGFTAESDAAAKGLFNPDRLTPASPHSESDTAFLD
ncbi:hypothetical protein [Xenorhabdus eapokensis]|uniref:hypothetical protein n=1 Tax=Xenorhabdus eapokensis TaxID=1873482 RepID=UPI000ACD6840|nr:hypothetical protein [Xenorhabdus eapokensis]